MIQIDRLCLETFVSDLSLLASISNINGSSIIGQQFYLVGLLTQLLARDYPSIIFQSDFDALVRKCLDYIIEIIKPDADLSK